MQLTYRGLAYSIDNEPSQALPLTETSASGTVSQTKIGLTYRGNKYEPQSRPAPGIRLTYTTLMYRGQSYKSLLPAVPAYQPIRNRRSSWQLQAQA